MRGNGLQSVGGLLARYKKLAPPQGIVVSVFIQVVERVCGVLLQKKYITYRVHSRTIGIQGGGPIKSEVTLKREAILRACREELGETNSPLHIV